MRHFTPTILICLISFAAKAGELGASTSLPPLPQSEEELTLDGFENMTPSESPTLPKSNSFSEPIAPSSPRSAPSSRSAENLVSGSQDVVAWLKELNDKTAATERTVASQGRLLSEQSQIITGLKSELAKLRQEFQQADAKSNREHQDIRQLIASVSKRVDSLEFLKVAFCKYKDIWGIPGCDDLKKR